MALVKQAAGMWLTADGTDCSKLPAFDWQAGGFHMQDTIAEHVRGVDDGNDPGYFPECVAAVDRFIHAPLADGAVDPSMASIRSDALVQHVGLFWEGSEHAANHDTAEKLRKENKWIRTNGKQILSCLALIAAAVALVLFVRYGILNIQDIRVEGNGSFSENKIIRASGIKRGDNTLLINEKLAEDRINQLYAVKFEAIERDNPHQVTIHVREREKVMFIRHFGVIYILDPSGMVLRSYEESAQETVMPDYPQVKGLDIRHCSVGQKIILNNEEQMSIYKQFALELKTMNLSGLVREIYLTDTANIYLGTDEGFSVRMGSAKRMHAKLRSLTLVLEQIRERKLPVGTIDVSDPGSPSYIPTTTT